MSNPVQASPNPDEAKVPQAVENTVKYHPDGTVDWAATEQASFIYRQGQEPGDKLDGHTHTIADALDAEVRAGVITPQQALESAQNSGLTTGPGAYEPPTVG